MSCFVLRTLPLGCFTRPYENNVMPFQCNFSHLGYFVSVILAVSIMIFNQNR